MAKKSHRMATVRAKAKKPRRVSIRVYADQLKKNMTKSEILLWSKLKYYMRVWDVKFETQAIVAGRFIADFMCRQERLIVEVNGSIHDLRRVKRKDAYRAKVLRGLGYRILVFTNAEVYEDLDKVLRTIHNSVK